MNRGIRKRAKLPLSLLAYQALKKAVANVIDEHRKSGRPLAIWRDGKVAMVPVDSLDGHKRRRTDRIMKRKGRRTGSRRRD